MKKVFAIALVFVHLLVLVGCNASDKISERDIVGKVYTYEKDGFGGNFTIEIKEDGTFSYYEGWLSSHIGIGEWSYSDGTLTLIEKVSHLNEESKEFEEVIISRNFSAEKNTLIFIEKDSANFIYVKIKDGEKFCCE